MQLEDVSTVRVTAVRRLGSLQGCQPPAGVMYRHSVFMELSGKNLFLKVSCFVFAISRVR